MAQKKEAEDGVVLVSPAGVEQTVKNPAAVNSLIYGSGYKPKQGAPDDAVARAAEQATAEDGTARDAEPKTTGRKS